MKTQLITVSKETEILCNINTMVDDIYSYLQEYHETYEQNPGLSEKEKEEDAEKWKKEVDEAILLPLRTYVQGLVIRSVKDALDSCRYSL